MTDLPVHVPVQYTYLLIPLCNFGGLGCECRATMRNGIQSYVVKPLGLLQVQGLGLLQVQDITERERGSASLVFLLAFLGRDDWRNALVILRTRHASRSHDPSGCHVKPPPRVKPQTHLRLSAHNVLSLDDASFIPSSAIVRLTFLTNRYIRIKPVIV